MSILHPHSHSSRAFTLIELLIVIAIIAILAVVVVLVLNPAQLLAQSRDSNRVSDLSTLNSAISMYEDDVSGSGIGTSSVVYTSLPSSQSNCGDQGLPTLPASSSYACASSQNYRSTNGSGWIPVDFQAISQGSPLGTLPVDPVNQTSTGLYYTYMASGNSYELTAGMESQKYKQVCANENGKYPDLCMEGTNLALAPIDFYASSSFLGSLPAGTLLSNTTTTFGNTTAGQTSTLTFSGNANQIIDLYNNFTGFPAWGADLYLKSSTGTILGATGAGYSAWNGYVVSQYALPYTGTYTLELMPLSTNIGDANVYLDNHIYSNEGTLAFGTSTVLSITQTNQTAIDTFSGTAGQVIDAYTTWTGFPGYGATLYFENASGTDLFCTGSGCNGWGGQVASQYALPYTGTYIVKLQPIYPNTGSVSVELENHIYTTGTVPFGATTTIPIAEYYASGLYTFSGTAGQSISLYNTFTGFPTWLADLYLESPTGTVLAANGGNYNTWNGYLVSNYSLPSTGTYTLNLVPVYPYTGTAEVYLTSP